MGYDHWAAKHNLKQMAATVTAYQQYGFSSPEELDEACSAAYAAMQESLTELKQVEKTLNGKKELQRQVLAYSKTRPVRDGLKQQKNAKAKAAYRQKHESDFIIADAAARYFRENGISKLPSYPMRTSCKAKAIPFPIRSVSLKPMQSRTAFPICAGTRTTVILVRTFKDPVFKPCLRTLKPEKSGQLS